MHLLMSYVLSGGTLMASTELKEILEKGFDVVFKMLIGKKFSQC